MDLRIKRQPSDSKQTLGQMEVVRNDQAVFSCKTLELAWRNNEPQISCIPTGTYQVVKRWSQKYGNHFHVLGVPGRSYILIHVGNYYTEIRGCILVGTTHTDINRDGYRDVTSSKATLNKLLELMPKSFTLTIN
ncbi:DUF5675 family protein [uncultured Pontibacter sp.]|uniref:DUF5675 family protein n=1 Tax=uncultured Pontibacter sp. TaxID=453356 RepID=UPI00262E016C|nr:DUF5675 family protein [uncultured Pontibacter sp.]